MNNCLNDKLACYIRAYHSFRSQPLFRAPLAARLLSAKEQAAIGETLIQRAHALYPELTGTPEEALALLADQLAPDILGRAVFFETSLRRAMRFRCRQYLIFGAGLDTFAWRNPFPQLRVFELDHPEQIADKHRRLTQAGLLPERAVFVPCDLTREEWPKALRRSGFRADLHTVCSLPGLSSTLSRSEFRALLCRLAELLPQGSEILLDHRTASGTSPAYDPWELEVLLGECGFLAYEHLSGRELAEQYFPAAPDLRAPDGVGYCLAVKKEHRGRQNIL